MIHAILAELERLPFAKMLENAQLGRWPLEGVLLDDCQPYDPEPEMRIAITDKLHSWTTLDG